jgi:Holliday junction resolvase
MKEKDLQKQIRDYLNSLPETFAFRVEQRPGMAHGCADIIGCRAGRLLAIECKIHPNKPTPLQERFLQKIREAGGIAIVAYSLEQLEDEWI